MQGIVDLQLSQEHVILLLLLLLLLQIRTQPHLGCCLAAATAAASAICMHLCTNSATPYTYAKPNIASNLQFIVQSVSPLRCCRR
jgi:hypothetical protein